MKLTELREILKKHNELKDIPAARALEIINS